MQRVRTYAHTQRRWSPAASGGGSRLAPVTRWRVAALCPAGPALLRLRRIAPPLETRGFALGRRACRRASWGFRLRVGLGLALLAVANPSWVWVWRSAGVLIPWQCCHRNRTPAARKNRVKRSVCRLSRCPLRALADTSTADTLREKSPSNAPCAACRGARFVPSRTPRQPTHSAEKGNTGAPPPPNPRVLAPLCACRSSGNAGGGGARALRCASLYPPALPCGLVCNAAKSSPPWLRLFLLRCSPLRWAHRIRPCAPLPRLLQKRLWFVAP